MSELTPERVGELRERVERRCSWYESEIEVVGNDFDKEWLSKDLSIQRDILALIAEKEEQLRAGAMAEPGSCKPQAGGSIPPPGSKSAPKVEPEVDNSGHPQAEERRETARAVKEAFASQREWADKWRGQDNPALEPKSDSYYETVRDRAVALILSPPAKEGVSVTSEEITSLANDLAKDTWLGRCQILEKWLRSIGIRVVEPSEAAEGKPEGGGE